MNRFTILSFSAVTLLMTTAACRAGGPPAQLGPAGPESLQNKLLDEIDTLQEVMTLDAGARVISEPSTAGNWYAAAMIDDQRDRAWSSARNSQPPFTFVFELDQIYHLKVLRFDNDAEETSVPGTSVHEVLVETAVSSLGGPFSEILRTRLQPLHRRQVFGVDADARWVRLIILSNYGSSRTTTLSDFKAYGFPRVVTPGVADVTGEWQTDYGTLELSQQGGHVTGCYHTFIGGAALIDGQVTKQKLSFYFAQENGAAGVGRMTLNAEGSGLSGIWAYLGDTRYRGQWYGKLHSAKVRECPGEYHLEQVIDRKWKKSRRVNLWSIRTRQGSDDLDSQSMPSVAHLASLLKSEKDLRVTIRVHCDQPVSEGENLNISNRRAYSLKKTLTDRFGIGGSRIETYGVGNSEPLAPQSSSWSPLIALMNEFVEVADARSPASGRQPSD